ncbi:MAG TPA: GNAT family N-acetyltransferase [Bacteroidales bacterium]|nr:GNAT family N-acetyltransferase [Bacteroidales bacterium]
MTDYRIYKAQTEDFPEILKLIKELALFEKAPEKVINTIDQMNNEKDLFRCLVVKDQNRKIIGFALYFYAYFTWVGKSLYLDDLYVKPEYRNKGIGTTLLKEIFKIAKKENCKRLRWQVLNWNTDAIILYNRSGAFIDNDWSNCDFDYEQIKNF